MTDGLDWFRRARGQQDVLNKFISLFIPLEVVLNVWKPGPQVELRKNARAIRRTLKGSLPREEADGLISWFNALVEKQKPSLFTRFELVARAHSQSAEADIKAFNWFNRIRNAIVHEGEQEVQLSFVSSDTVVILEQLVEKYLKIAVGYVLINSFATADSD